MGRPGGPRLETAQNLQEIVLRVRGQRVSPGVHADARTARDAVVETHVGGLRLVKLHVPVAVRWYLLAELLSQADLSESRAVGRERPCRKGSRTCTSHKSQSEERYVDPARMFCRVMQDPDCQLAALNQRDQLTAVRNRDERIRVKSAVPNSWLLKKNEKRQ